MRNDTQDILMCIKLPQLRNAVPCSSDIVRRDLTGQHKRLREGCLLGMQTMNLSEKRAWAATRMSPRDGRR